jgi:hypothetical protein
MILSYNQSNIVQIEENTMTILQRQFINDTKGIPMGVILPLEIIFVSRFDCLSMRVSFSS